MKQELLDLYKHLYDSIQGCQSKYQESMGQVYQIIDANTKGELPDEQFLAEMADAMYAVRETSNLINAFRKVLDKILEEMTGVYTKKVELQLSSNAELVRPTIKTEYVTCKIEPKYKMPFPSSKKDPEEFQKFMSELGIPPLLIKHHAVLPAYDGFPNYLNELFQKGEPLPGNLDLTKTYVILDCSLRRRKGMIDND